MPNYAEVCVEVIIIVSHYHLLNNYYVPGTVIKIFKHYFILQEFTVILY